MPDRGNLKWYFQFTPHDLHDYDSTEIPFSSMQIGMVNPASC